LGWWTALGQCVYALGTNSMLIMTLIGLCPLGLLLQMQRLRLRFTLAVLSAAFLGFGAVLAPLQFLLQKAGYPLNEYPIIVLYVEIAVGFGFIGALKNRNELHDRVVYLRWLIFMASLVTPATIVPGLIATGAMARDSALFHNDWIALLCWALLILPPLIAFWFWGIKEIHKGDRPPDGL
jgi:hypothetical protein